jgi:hypothetical protein
MKGSGAMTNARRFLNDERGAALPIAMLALIILSALIIGFSVMASTEPTIANNQLKVAQARAVAEAGIEQAVWALNNPTEDKGMCPGTIDGGNCLPPVPALWTPPERYGGNQPVSVATGGAGGGVFKITVAAATTPTLPPECPPLLISELCIVSRGFAPNDTATNKAVQKIAVKVFNPKFLFKDPPAALSVRGELDAGGTSLINSRSDKTCGAKDGTFTTGNTAISGTADIYGADGDDKAQPKPAGTPYDPSNPTGVYDALQAVPTSTFDQYIWTNADIDALRAYAIANNGRPGVTYLQGSVTFDSSNQIPEGLVFVDTVSGNDITQEGVTPPTPPPDFANVAIHGNAGSGDDGVFSGLLFVNGTLSIDGSFAMHGFAYAQNDISYHGIGTGGVWGAMMSRNIRDLSSTSIDSDLLGQSLINYNCGYIKTGGDKLPKSWSLEAGTYKELSGS